jgi:hypothetical protein
MLDRQAEVEINSLQPGKGDEIISASGFGVNHP